MKVLYLIIYICLSLSPIEASKAKYVRDDPFMDDDPSFGNLPNTPMSPDQDPKPIKTPEIPQERSPSESEPTNPSANTPSKDPVIRSGIPPIWDGGFPDNSNDPKWKNPPEWPSGIGFPEDPKLLPLGFPKYLFDPPNDWPRDQPWNPKFRFKPPNWGDDPWKPNYFFNPPDWPNDEPWDPIWFYPPNDWSP